MGLKGSSKKLLSYAFSEVVSNIHWSGVGTGENYYLSEVINLSNIHLSRFNCIYPWSVEGGYVMTFSSLSINTNRFDFFKKKLQFYGQWQVVDTESVRQIIQAFKDLRKKNIYVCQFFEPRYGE